MSRPPVTIGGGAIGGGAPLALISGPCVVEAREVMLRCAEVLSRLQRRLGITVVFKSSYEKDNRTQADAFRGPGLEPGLAALAEVRRAFGLPVLSDVHRVTDVPAAAEVLDVLQIPALLCRQTSLLEAVGAAGRPVNLKKGQFASVAVMAGAVEKLRRAGAGAVLLTERGACYGPEQLVVDFAALADLAQLDCPVVIDAGHAARQRRDIELLARCGAAAGVDALFLECHPDPARARCDGSRSVPLGELPALVERALELHRLASRPLRPRS